MSIEKSDSWKTSDEQRHGSLEEAQKHELNLVLNLGADHPMAKEVYKNILEDADRIVAILTSTGRKPRKKKPGRPKGSKNKSVAKETVNEAGMDLLERASKY